ncbi:MAG: ABC transporter ATP-binding protein [Brevinemataceae bacterium]
MNIISARNISKSYHHPQGNLKVKVLENLSFDAAQGESFALVGESGSGKTTLLYLLSGLDKPNQGEITIQNTKIENLSENELSLLRAEKFGFVFQHHFLLNDLDALENALLPLRINNKMTEDAVEQTKYLFERLGIQDRMNHEPKEMSGGECQRVAVIRALVNKPLIVFADEPTGSLDRGNAEILENILFDLTQTHSATLILSTHNQNLARKCTRHSTIEELEQQ